VSSTDTRGYVSGVSWELPNGITDLVLETLSGGATVRLAWTGIATDVRGGWTSVDKYVLYAGDQPITRARTDTLTPLMDNIRAASVDIPVNPQHKYYTVIVVDLRGNKSPF